MNTILRPGLWLLAITSLSVGALALLVGSSPSAQAQDESAQAPQGQHYQIDPVHASFVFRVKHLGIGYIYGRFNQMEGQFNLEGEEPFINITVQANSVDTGHQKRDEHLVSPDFFAAAQYPTISFKSSSVAPQQRTHEETGQTYTVYRVQGDLTLHGTTKPLSVDLIKTGEGEDPWGGYRKGMATNFTVKRSEFGMDHSLGAVSDQVRLLVTFEGTRTD
jgi:polyisoprenoid-binding protein YceI